MAMDQREREREEVLNNRRGRHEDYPDLLRRDESNPILTASQWPYPAHTVFNPGATRFNDEVLLLVRVEDRRGISHLTVARSRDGRTGWQIDPEPTFLPDPIHHPEEIWGIEDPRITWLEEKGQFAVVYTAYSRGGPLVSLALTEDFRSFERVGAIMAPEDKDAALFPRKIGGRWALLHRPVPASGLGAHIWISYSPDLRHWGDNAILLFARRGAWWDAEKIGLNTPPLETPEGWLLLYHGVRKTASGSIYRLGLALLDLEDPTRILRRSDNWIFGPREPYELVGDVPDVVFPCGWVHDAETDELQIYYGGADTCVCRATARLSDVLDYILASPEPVQAESIL